MQMNVYGLTKKDSYIVKIIAVFQIVLNSISICTQTFNIWFSVDMMKSPLIPEYASTILIISSLPFYIARIVAIVAGCLLFKGKVSGWLLTISCSLVSISMLLFFFDFEASSIYSSISWCIYNLAVFFILFFEGRKYFIIYNRKHLLYITIATLLMLGLYFVFMLSAFWYHWVY